MTTLGRLIADARARLGRQRRKRVTQAELAAMLGVSRSAVNSWENGRSIPDDYDWAGLVEVLGEYLIPDPSAIDRERAAAMTREQLELLWKELGLPGAPPEPPADESGSQEGAD